MDKRLALIATGLNYGGAEHQVVALALGLQSRGWLVQVTSLIPPSDLADRLTAANIRVTHLSMRRGVPNPLAAWRAIRQLRAFRPTVVHSHQVHANLLARVIRPFLPRTALICTAHNTYESAPRRNVLREVTWRERAYRLSDSLCDVTTQISRMGLERYVRVKACPKSRIRLIPNGIDTDRFSPSAEIRSGMRESLGVGSSFVWLAVGRFEEVKDYPNLLRALASCQDRDSLLLIAGIGPLESEMQELAAALGIQARVRWLGLRRDVPDLMRAADAFVMSSLNEGLPLVVQEAQASALPVAATLVGGIPELVAEGETGFLAPPRNAAALAACMDRIVSLAPVSRLEMGKRGRLRMERCFGMPHVLDLWESLYAEFAT